MDRDTKKIMDLFITYQQMKRKQIVLYSGMSDRKVRDLIKYLRCVYLPSLNGNTHTIIFNPSTRFYEYTDDPAKIEMAKAYHKSYANAEWENIQALDITLRKINSRSRQLELL